MKLGVFSVALELGWACCFSAGVARAASLPPESPSDQASLDLPFEAIHMIDRKDGWAQTARCQWVGNSWTFPREHILRTTDGGKNWKSVWSADPQQCLGTFFRDGQTAWIANAVLEEGTNVTVFRTHDGGRSWTRTDFSQWRHISGFSLSFPDPKTGWLNLNSVLTMNSEAGSLYHTQDGGAHWRCINGTGPSLDKAEEDMAKAEQGAFATRYLPFAGSIRFRNTSTGWLFGAWESTAPAFLFITRDGGRNWKVQTLPLPAGIHGGRMEPMGLPQFIPSDGKHGILLAQLLATNGLPANPGTEIYSTRDGGLSWRPTTLIRSWNCGRNMSFIRAREGWLWNPEPHSSNSTAPVKGQLLHTTDRGLTWQPVPPVKGLEEYLTRGQDIVQLQFVDDRCGWALARDPHDDTQLLQTTDGGLTWNRIETKIHGSR